MGDIRTFRNKRMHFNLTDDELERFQPISNMVLVKVHKKTDIDDSGFLVWKGSGNAAAHSERVVEIVKVPKNLYFKPGDVKSLYSKTEIEIQPGDVAIINHLEALNSWIFSNGEMVDGRYENEYYLVKYDSIIVVQRGKEILPINGYILLEESKETLKFLEFEKVVVNKKYGIVKYMGSVNKDYARNYDSRGGRLKGKIWSDYGYESMKPGCKVAFESKRLGNSDPIWRLEHSQHSEIGEYLVCHRPRIAAIMND